MLGESSASKLQITQQKSGTPCKLREANLISTVNGQACIQRLAIC